jgi:hypothetical protein
MGRGEMRMVNTGHIISAGWVSHLPLDHSCKKEGLQDVYELITIIL